MTKVCRRMQGHIAHIFNESSSSFVILHDVQCLLKNIANCLRDNIMHVSINTKQIFLLAPHVIACPDWLSPINLCAAKRWQSFKRPQKRTSSVVDEITFAGVCVWGVIFGSSIHDSIMKLLGLLNYHVKRNVARPLCGHVQLPNLWLFQLGTFCAFRHHTAKALR